MLVIARLEENRKGKLLYHNNIKDEIKNSGEGKNKHWMCCIS